MYPTVIVVLVELHRSLWETDEVSRELTGMQFAGNPEFSTGMHTFSGGIGESSSATFAPSKFSRKKDDSFGHETHSHDG
jgi:hypothetical protein